MSTNLCPHCGTPNLPQARFCAQCGKQLPSQPLPGAGATINCPQCGEPLRSGARFCNKCGYHLVQQPAPAAAPPSPPPAPPVMPPAAPRMQAPPPAQAQPGAGATQLLGSSEGNVNLIVRWMGGSTQSYPLSKPAMVVGRAPGNDVVINHPAVSGRHLSLTVTPTGYTVVDMNSTNGTMVNGHRISANTPQSLNQGDVLRIGDLTGNSVSLVIQAEGAEAMRALSLGKFDLSQQTQVIIGRDPNSYLPLNHPAVSFRHAMVYKQDSNLMVRDLNSTNGTFINGQRITQPVPLKSGDVIQIGPFRLNYDAQAKSLEQSMGMGHRIDTIRLGREVAQKKMILQEVTMTIQPGEFVALVGGSGAGKSTLMKAMNGYEPANHGRIFLDGQPLYERLDLYRTSMGYVPQDDIIHRALPVRLALWYSAKLRLPDARPAEIEARIQDALRAVDMVEHANKPVRVLSGGQRKRVSIAVELLARPTLFFLDEPTSGLDPGLEKKMMYDLNRLADEGRTVVLVTHATANIEQCDHVAFMTYGRLAYYGPPDDALKFYNVRDFSDIYLKLSQEVDPSRGKPVPPELQPYYQGSGKVSAGVLWAEAYRRSPYYQKYVVDRQSRLGSAAGGGGRVGHPQRRGRDSFIRQTFILARRQFDLIRMDKRTLLILLLMMPLIGLLFGFVGADDKWPTLVGYTDGEKKIDERLINELKKDGLKKDEKEQKYTPLENAQMIVAMLGLAITQGGTFMAAYEIVKERGIYRRERAVNLSVIAYVLSKVLVLGIFAILQVASVLFVLGIFMDLGFKGAIFTDAGVLELYITMYLSVMASILFGLCISALVPNSDVVLYAILVQLFVQIILSGALFPLGKPDKEKPEEAGISKATVAYWTMNAMGSTFDLKKMNNEARVCTVIEVPADMMDPSKGNKLDTQCSNAKGDLYLNYTHEEGHLMGKWIGLLMHCMFWFGLTVFLQSRQKGE
ncbi:MAG: FHA domain-containing protein [Anaerolineales bacterium]|nr:FHA domain-containing protein [Anaerolineales bacterium]